MGNNPTLAALQYLIGGPNSVCVSRCVSAVAAAGRGGGLGGQRPECPCEHSTSWEGPRVPAGPLGGSRYPLATIWELTSGAMRGGFGGSGERVAVKGCWGPGLMESGKLGGHSRLIGPNGKKQTQGCHDSPGQWFSTRRFSPLGDFCGHFPSSWLQRGRCCRCS